MPLLMHRLHQNVLNIYEILLFSIPVFDAVVVVVVVVVVMMMKMLLLLRMKLLLQQPIMTMRRRMTYVDLVKLQNVTKSIARRRE